MNTNALPCIGAGVATGLTAPIPSAFASPRAPRASARLLAAQLGVAALVCLAGCAAPSKPSAVDEATRRPANDPSRIEKLRVQFDGEREGTEQDLQRRTIEAHRSAREILASAAVAAPVPASAARSAVLVSARKEGSGGSTRLGAQSLNAVFTVNFALASSQLALGAEEARELVQAAQAAPMIVVRGRTDAAIDNAFDARLARERAEGMRKLLVAGGINAERIRLQYQGAGDFVADNQTTQGRALNRRVEVELYGAVPGVTVLGNPVPGPAALPVQSAQTVHPEVRDGASPASPRISAASALAPAPRARTDVRTVSQEVGRGADAP